jgi:hypothetical protein
MENSSFKIFNSVNSDSLLFDDSNHAKYPIKYYAITNSSENLILRLTVPKS